jgi:hypothetical protein
MPITFVNIWETKILDTIRTFLNAEFAGEKQEAEEAIEGLNVVRWEWRASYMGNIS